MNEVVRFADSSRLFTIHYLPFTNLDPFTAHCLYGVSQSHSMSSQFTTGLTPTTLHLPLPLMPENGPVPPSSVTLPDEPLSFIFQSHRAKSLWPPALAESKRLVHGVGGERVDIHFDQPDLVRRRVSDECLIPAITASGGCGACPPSLVP
jgi:hypothetical protein